MSASERQREIIDAALELIHAQGLQELTMKRIAEAIGVSEPALYKHFPSKSEILSAVVDVLEAAGRGAVSTARAAGGDPLNTLSAFFRAHAKQFGNRPALMAVLFSDDLFRHDRALTARVVTILSENREMIATELERGKKAGLIRPDADADTVAMMLAGGFRLLVSTWRLRDMSFDLMRRTEAFVTHSFAMFRT